MGMLALGSLFYFIVAPQYRKGLEVPVLGVVCGVLPIVAGAFMIWRATRKATGPE
jgi:hypothetical protein